MASEAKANYPFAGVRLLNLWFVNHLPAVATQATITKAAGAAGVQHVAWAIYASVSTAGTAQTPLVLSLIDGASGGTAVWAVTLSAPINSAAIIYLPNLGIVGTAATAMTLEFAGATAAAAQGTVTLIGYDVA